VITTFDSLAAPGSAVATPGFQIVHQLDIPAGALRRALRELALQTGVQLVHFSTAIPRSMKSPALQGAYTLEQALARMLDGTGLAYRFANERTVVIVAGQTAASPTLPAPLPAAAHDSAPSQGRARSWLARLAAFFAVCAPATGTVCAQEAEVATLEEVTVTAQRREESMQETPIAITAFAGEALEAQRVTNVMDLMNKVPSLTLVPFAGTRAAPNLFIRGMGNLNAQTTKDNATGIYIDGVPVGRSIGLATDIADLERVEVLRGPQGTLWGRNTTAGAINFITKRPDDQLSFGVRLTAGSWEQRSGRVKINVPVTDKLFVRAVYMRGEDDGWIDNLNATLPNQINFNEDRKKQAMRLAVRFAPTENFTADYAYDNSEMMFGNHFYQVIGGPTAVPGRQESSNSVLGLHPSDTEVGGHSLTLAWELGSVTLKSISGYRDLDSRTDMNFIDAFTQGNVQAQHQFSQELQVIGNVLGGRVKYAAGLFYFEEGSHEAITSSFAGGALIDSWLVWADGTSAAIYGQATWTPPILNDRMDLTLGVRYTEDSRKATKTYLNPGFTPALTGQVVAGDRDFSSFNPAVTVAYRFSDAIHGYGKFSTGYRAGGFNTQSTPAFFGPGFNEENVEAWEVGLKSDLLERRLRVNLAAFRSKYTDLQVDQRRTPAIFTDTLNAGSATVKGVELESVAIIGRGLSANIFYSWLDGEYGSYIDNGVDYASARYMQNAPKNQLGAGFEYAFPHFGIGDLTLSVDYRKQDEFYANPLAYSLSPGYEVWNARLQLAAIPVPQGTLRLAAWARNLADERYRLATTNLGQMAAQFGPPRAMGVDLSYEF